MTFTRGCLFVLAACLLGPAARASGQETRDLRVHLAQANNNSPYAFVRAKFNPGELASPWAVRFFDDGSKEVPYFVWDSVTWRVAREGRPDWGKRYALLNHGPGDSPRVVEARARKLAESKKSLPELGAQLETREQAAGKAPDSVCAALYLLRYPVPAFGKERLTLRTYPKEQVEPNRTTWNGSKVEKRVNIARGAVELRDLPDRLAVSGKVTEVVKTDITWGGTAIEWQVEPGEYQLVGPGR